MTQKALLLLVLALAGVPSARATGDSFSRIEAGCRKQLEGDTRNPKAVCSCVVRNFKTEASRFSADQLDVIAASYSQDKKAEEELQEDKYSEIVLFDYDVGEGCLKDPASFTYKN